jgi:hypothetical protein
MTNQNKNNEAKAPSLVAFHVRENKNGKGKSFWTRIGAAWPHEDGEGFNVTIEMMPLDGKIVLRKPKADEKEGA